ncbi:MAG: relaxase [Burkholderiales bacterium]|nr:relaxase [Burkholderiales bacterium]
MILKASQRGGSGQLAAHLLKTEENEHVDVHEVRGFMVDDLDGALHEAYAMSRGTRCSKFLFSVSLNPPENEDVSVDKFENALDRIESKLGLENQPRVVVFHEKEGRRHAHCVWSRIKTDEMKAVRMSHYKNKLMDVSRQLYLENKWEMPKGLIDKNLKSPLNYTRAEWQQALRTGQNPKVIKAALQESWAISDSRKAFEHALQDRGYYLARGDKRGYVAVNTYGEVYSLVRQIGVKKPDLSRKLGKTELLPSVAEAKQTISGRLTKQFKGYSDELNSKHKREMTPLVHTRQTLTQRHRDARSDQKAAHEKRWQAEEFQRAARLRKGFKGIWDRLTGTHQRTRAKNEAETLKCRARDRNEKETLITEQLAERRKLQSQFKQLRQKQTGERAELFKGMDKQYQKLGHQNEIRKLWEQEKHRMRQTIKNRDSTDHDPEI